MTKPQPCDRLGLVIFMKVLAIPDPHFRLDLAYADYVNDRRRGEKSAVLHAVIDAATRCDAVCLMGDNLHLRHNHSTVIKEFVGFVRALASCAPVYICAGNHEVYNGTETAIDFLREAGIPRVSVITVGPEYRNIDGKKVVFLPYCTNAALGVDSFEDGAIEIMRRLDRVVGNEQFDAIFLHHTISGSTTSGGLADIFGEIVLSREELEKRFKLVIGGHIHTPQRLGSRTIITGSLFTSEVGETKKSLWQVDLDSQDVTEMALPIRAIHKVEITATEEIATMDQYDPSSIVKCIVRSHDVDIDIVRDKLRRFNAYILVEDYPSERQKLRIDDGALEDLSIENLLRVYAKQNNIQELDLIKAYNIVRK